MPTIAPPSLHHSAKIGLPFIVVLLLAWFYFGSPLDSGDLVRGKFLDDHHAFLADFDVDGLDRSGGTAIQEVCAAKTWTEGLVFSCEAAGGGVSEVRNALLTCIRVAIEAGAELVLPRIVRRPASNPALEKPNAKGFHRGDKLSHFFDENHLRDVLASSCPQLHIYSSLDDLYDKPTLLNPLKFSLQDVVQAFDHDQVVAAPQAFAVQFARWLDTKSPPDTRRWPVRVEMAETRNMWPTATDGTEFRWQFGALLRTRADMRQLAGSAIWHMQHLFGIDADPRNGWHEDDSFVGVDLRTLHVHNGDYPSYTVQAANYLTYVAQWELPVAYLTAGATDDDALLFAKRAADFNVTTVRANDVLDSAERRYMLTDLSWDQRLLVDYEVLRRAGRFAGPSRSAMAWDLTVRRHYAWNKTELEDGGVPQSKYVADGEGWGNVQFRDEYSILYGQTGMEDVMRLTTWP